MALKDGVPKLGLGPFNFFKICVTRVLILGSIVITYFIDVLRRMDDKVVYFDMF